MKILRAPITQFESLQDYPFRANYSAVDDQLQMHYVDEGKGPVVLLLHG